jgi:hypothetical protein
MRHTLFDSIRGGDIRITTEEWRCVCVYICMCLCLRMRLYCENVCVCVCDICMSIEWIEDMYLLVADTAASSLEKLCTEDVELESS